MIPMRGNTIAMLVLAVVFGAIAVFAANIWLRSQQPREAVQRPEPAKVELSTIVVASKDLTFGEPLAPDFLREIPWPRDAVPDGAFAKISDINKDGNRVVLSAIGPNEPVLKWKISGPGARASLSALVTEGMRAVTIRVNDTTGVAGFILPGDRVDVLYTRGGGNSTIDVLLQNVRVIALNKTADEKKSEPITARVATVELTPIDAQKISLAQSTGSLTLTLRSAGSLDQAPAQRIVEQELVSNPSIYQTTFDAQAAAQAALDARLKGLEGNLTQVAQKVEATGAAGIEAQKAADAALEAKIKGLEGSLSQIAMRVDDTANGKALLDAKLTDIESKLRGEIAKAGASSSEVKSKLAALEDAVKQTAKATGAGEVELRKKLAALETAIRQASSATGEGEEALRSRLAEFEASLRQMMTASNKPVPAVIVQPAAVQEVVPTTVNIKIYRGMKDSSYTVPLDLTQR